MVAKMVSVNNGVSSRHKHVLQFSSSIFLILSCGLSDTFGPISVLLKSFINNTLMLFEISWKKTVRGFTHS